MYLGIIFTLLICLIILSLGLITSFFAFKKKGPLATISKSYAMVIFGISIVYAMGAFPSIFAYYNKLSNLDDFFTALIIVADLISVFTISYLVNKIFSNKRLNYIVVGVYTLGFMYFLYLAVTEDTVMKIEKMYFTYDFTFSPKLMILFGITIIPMIILMIYDLFKSSRQYSKERNYKNRVNLLYAVSILAVYAPSFLAAIGIMAGWQLVLLCIIVLAAMLVGLYATFLEEGIDL